MQMLNEKMSCENPNMFSERSSEELFRGISGFSQLTLILDFCSKRSEGFFYKKNILLKKIFTKKAKPAKTGYNLPIPRHSLPAISTHGITF